MLRSGATLRLLVQAASGSLPWFEGEDTKSRKGMHPSFFVLGHPNSGTWAPCRPGGRHPVRRAAGRRADPRVLDPNALTALALGDDGIEVRLLDLARLGDLELVATGFLAEPEQAEYAELRHPLRRREWLGARVCLKLMAVDQGLVGAPLDCAVIKDPRGRPRLVFTPGLVTDVVADCSLSHKGRFACAATASALGVADRRRYRRRSPLACAGSPRQFAHERDRLLGSHPEDERLAILWALKEACSKVVGRGLAMALREVACEEIAPGRHRVTTEALELTGRHTMHEGYAVALCVGSGLAARPLRLRAALPAAPARHHAEEGRR